MTEGANIENVAGNFAEKDSHRKIGAGPARFLLWMWLITPVAILLLACLLQANEGRLIQIRGVATPLPELCTFQRTTRVDCPGCGLTRSFIALVRGDLSSAWSLNMASPLVFVFVLLQIPLATLRLLQPDFSWNHWLAKFNVCAMIFVAAMLFVQWTYRLIIGDLV